MAVTTSRIPEQGQLVTVRQRHFVVTEVAKSTLPDKPLQASGNGHQHLVTLSSVEDDALGEELQVVWEIEPGARAIEKVALPEPTGFDPPDRLDAFLDAVRWARPHRRRAEHPVPVPLGHRHRGLPARPRGPGHPDADGSTC